MGSIRNDNSFGMSRLEFAMVAYCFVCALNMYATSMVMFFTPIFHDGFKFCVGICTKVLSMITISHLLTCMHCSVRLVNTAGKGRPRAQVASLDTGAPRVAWVFYRDGIYSSCFLSSCAIVYALLFNTCCNANAIYTALPTDVSDMNHVLYQQMRSQWLTCQWFVPSGHFELLTKLIAWV